MIRTSAGVFVCLHLDVNEGENLVWQKEFRRGDYALRLTSLFWIGSLLRITFPEFVHIG